MSKYKTPRLDRLETVDSVIIAEGGLHKLTGNRSAYFSLTGKSFMLIRLTHTNPRASVLSSTTGART